jgi:hypothetical protein
MTEYEISDIAGNAFGNGMNSFTVFFSIVTAYLVAAHTAGKSLSTTQIVIVNMCYVVAAAFFGTFTTVAFMRGAELTREVQFGVNEKIGSDVGWMWITAIIILVITASFCFMWSVRHPKTE